ncbi:MAG: prephenate dehydrogenase/arogenate dehydrogenase family protein [Actinomycetota bacterium]
MTNAKQAVIVGVGLIGGSIGLALRAEGWHVVGVDHDAERLAEAVERGVIDEIGALEAVPPVDLGIVATPADSVPGLVRSLLDAGVAAVTDVGSVKAAIATEVDDPRFVPGHPMAGSEQDGLDGAAAHLFSGAMWVLCPTPTTDDQVFTTIRDFVRVMGANAIAIPAERHDQLVAVISHVPHLTAATLMRLADGRANEDRALLRLAAGGFRDMTRIAAGHPAIWPDICVQNAEPIVSTLDDLIAELSSIRDVVADRDRARLLERLEGARVARRNLPTTIPSAEAISEMRVPVLDRQGELAAIATLAAELDVNIYDLEIAHSAEGPRGVVVLVIETAMAERLQGGLMALGYRPSVRSLEG